MNEISAPYRRITMKKRLDKSKLPSPLEYYQNEFDGLNTKHEWATVNCCFHDDNNPSLNINLIHGHFRCFSCGAKGGDLISFHQLKYDLSFIEAVNHFDAWSRL